MIVCSCAGLNDRVIRHAVAEGAESIDDLAMCCGAGAGCGTCHESLRALLAEGGERAHPDVRRLRLAAFLATRSCGYPGPMRGDSGVIEVLNDVLTGELTAINQYFIHAKMCENWGYERLAAKVRDESIDEMKHAEQLIDRILFLDGMPEHATAVHDARSARPSPSSSSSTSRSSTRRSSA